MAVPSPGGTNYGFGSLLETTSWLFSGTQAPLSAGFGGGTYGRYVNDVHDFHKVRISIQSEDQSMNGINILAHTPSEVELALVSNWDERKGNLVDLAAAAGRGMRALGMGGAGTKLNAAAPKLGVGGKLLQGAGMITGYTSMNKLLTGLMWSGASYLEMQLSLEFFAKSDPMTEVWLPTYFLMALATPVEYNVGLPSMLRAPGPTLVGTATAGGIAGGDRTTITIGSYLRLQNVVINNVTATVLSRLHKSGLPVATKVDLSFKSFFVATRNDLAKWMRVEEYVALGQAANAALNGNPLANLPPESTLT